MACYAILSTVWILFIVLLLVLVMVVALILSVTRRDGTGLDSDAYLPTRSRVSSTNSALPTEKHPAAAATAASVSPEILIIITAV